MTPRKKKLLLVGGGVAAGLLLAELALQLYSLLAPPRIDILRRARAPISVKDPRLRLRPNPDFRDHDENGFRNASVPKEAFVVAMGDSQTYGTGVRREENWPHRLAERTGRTIYGISFGGWGPTQSLLLIDRALALKPHLILEAFYTGNDLFDCFQTVYYDRQLRELATTEPISVEAIRAAERKEPLGRYDEFYGFLLGRQRPRGDRRAAPASGQEAIRSFLRRHSKLYQLASLARQAAKRLFRRSGWDFEKQEAQTGPGRQFNRIFEHGAFRTIFNPVLRSTAMDLDDPRLAEGHRLALEAIGLMHERTRAVGTEFLVLLIPTKELVFRDAAAKANFAADGYWRVIEKEELLRARTMEFLRSRDIPFVDALPVLRESLASGVQPYPESPDSHPNPAGHRGIARVAADEMKRRGLAGGGAGR